MFEQKTFRFENTKFTKMTDLKIGRARSLEAEATTDFVYINVTLVYIWCDQNGLWQNFAL